MRIDVKLYTLVHQKVSIKCTNDPGTIADETIGVENSINKGQGMKAG